MRMMISRLVAAGGVALLVVAAAPAAAQDDAPLVTAAAEQDRVAVRALLDAGADVNAARADGATALLYAAHWDDLEGVPRRCCSRQAPGWTPPTTTA